MEAANSASRGEMGDSEGQRRRQPDRPGDLGHRLGHHLLRGLEVGEDAGGALVIGLADSVGCAPRAVRVSSRAPSRSSSRATRRQRTGLESPIRSAARAKEPVSTTPDEGEDVEQVADECSIFRNTMMR